MLRAIVVDDEIAGIEAIKILASRNADQIRIVADTQDAEKALVLIEDYRPDLVFLDINMPEMNGFELLNRLRYRDFKLIFTTAHSEYAIQAIRQKAFDYLLKPIDAELFSATVADVFAHLMKLGATSGKEQYALIELQVKDGIQYIRQQDIIRLEASRSYTEFYLENGVKQVASKPLKEFETKLDMRLFYRCHKSHIVNLEKVKKFVNHDGFFALMNDGSMPEISKVLKDELLKRLKEL